MKKNLNMGMSVQTKYKKKQENRRIKQIQYFKYMTRIQAYKKTEYLIYKIPN